jgi:glycerol-3-phosphate acyltransferase PlsX
MVILLDAMGGDKAPDANIKGAVKAINQIEAEVVLVGNKEVINGKIKEFYGKNDISEISPRLKIHHTTETIEMEDIPTQAIKHKKDSSMVVGFNLLKEGKGDVFISAGNSGALLTGATLLVGRIKGVDRPALAGILPAYKSRLVLMDCGANTNCKPINLFQFAQMASIYLKTTLGVQSPRVGLLNIGTEETKGNDLMKESYQLLKEKAKDAGVNFIGNVEGRDAFSGNVDIVVTDGFTGNIFLKAIEGLGKFVKRTLSESLKKNLLSKIAAIPSLPAINRFAKTVDYKEYGGALFLGVKKPVVKAHGSSDEKLFEFTIKQAEQFVKNKAVEQLIEEFEKEQKMVKQTSEQNKEEKIEEKMQVD